MRAFLLSLVLLTGNAVAHPDLEQQIVVLNEAIRANPGAADLYLLRGDLHRRHGDWDAAQTDFNTARVLDPALTDLDWREGHTLVDAGQLAAGEALLTRFLERYPGHAGALETRAQARSMQGRHREAAEDFAASIAHGKQPAPVLFSNLAVEWLAASPPDANAAQAVLEQALQRFPAEVSLQGLAVDLALAEGRVLRARQLLETADPALQRLPQWAWRQNLATCLAGGADAARAVQELATPHGLTVGRRGTWQAPDLPDIPGVSPPDHAWCRNAAKAGLDQEVALRLGVAPSP